MAVLTALAVSQLLLAALAAGRILRIERPGTDAPAPWRRILGYAAAVGGVMICDAIVWQRSEIFFLKFYASPQETGYYNVAFSLSSQLVKLVPLGLLSVLTPLFAAYHGTRDSMRLERLFAGSTRVLCYVTFPLVAALSALGVPLVRFVYGEAYSQAASVLWILALSSAIGAIAGAGAGLLLGMERQRVILRVGVFVAVLNLALDLLLIKPYGLRGAALANALSQITAALVGLGYVFVVVRPAFPARPIVKCLGAALAAGAAMALLDRWAPAWAALAAGLALYALCLSRSRAFLSEERDALLHLASMAPARVSPLLRRAFTLLLGSGPARG